MLDAWVREPGAPGQRPSFGKITDFLSSEGQTLSAMIPDLVGGWPLTLRFGLGLACGLAHSPAGHEDILGIAIAKIPTERLSEMAQLLESFGTQEAGMLLSPLLYKPGPEAENAAFLLAADNVSISLSDLPNILQSRVWSMEGRRNILSMIPVVIRDDAGNMFKGLLGSASGERLDQVTSIISLLKQSELLEPVIPKSLEKAQSDDASVKAVSPLIESQESPPRFVSKREKSDSGMKDWIPQISLAVVFCVLAWIGYVTLTNPLDTIENRRSGLLPKPGERVWIDAVTRKVVTESFLMADKEFRMGEIFRLRGQPRDAVEFFRAAANRDPTHLEAQDRLGYCFYKLKSFEAAEDQFKKALKIDPDFYRSHFYLGRIYRGKQRWTEALSEFRLAFAGKKDLAQIGLEFLDLLIRLGEFEEGRSVATELSRRFPTNRNLADRIAQLPIAQRPKEAN